MIDGNCIMLAEPDLNNDVANGLNDQWTAVALHAFDPVLKTTLHVDVDGQ